MHVYVTVCYVLVHMDAFCLSAVVSKVFKTRADYSNLDDYARYVKANISVGMTVRCCESFEEVKQGDLGTVLKVDNDGLHDLNVQANWQEKGGTYWVRFTVCDLVEVSESSVDSMAFKVGGRVRVKRAVMTPKYV